MNTQQIHVCSCGIEVNADTRQCPVCERWGMMPRWEVIDGKGKIIHLVYGGSEREAIESAQQTPSLDGISYTIRPSFTFLTPKNPYKEQ